MDSFVEEQCHAIVLGCTEIPLAIEETEYKGVPIINPLWMMHLLRILHLLILEIVR